MQYVQNKAITQKSVGVTEARTRFSELVDEVRYQGDSVLLVKSGKPAAVMIPVEMYEKWQSERDKRFEVFTSVQKKNLDVSQSEDELLKLLEAAKHQVRKSE